nr:hypothetical protein [Pedococcus sp. 5OH_020]
MTARTSANAITLLASLQGSRIGDLWLDNDLIGGDTVQPVLDPLLALATMGTPLDVVRIHVHSSNIREGHRVCAELVQAGYPARRSYAANMWVRARFPSPPRGTSLPRPHRDDQPVRTASPTRVFHD